MTKKEILHLGNLARITLSDRDAERLNTEIGDIIEYIGAVQEIASEGNLEKKVGARYNVLREDVVTNKAGFCTEDILNSAPEREGQYIKVKKILTN